jgi:hypothetical protein
MPMGSLKSLATAVAATALVAGLAPPAFAQTVSEVGVTTRAPTSVRIHLAGKTRPEVRQEVVKAAALVCRNAIHNDELAFSDQRWCQQSTRQRAMRRYTSIMSRYATLATSEAVITLSAL